MPMNKKLKKSALNRGRCASIALSISTALLAVCGFTGVRAQSARPTSNARQGPVRVQLFDVHSGLALPNFVEVTSDNGIRCSAPPCATGSRTWSSHIDGSGVLMIPPSAIQFDTYLKTKDHRSAKLPEDTTKGTTYTHEIELYPEWLFDEQHDWTRGYKVVDARSGKVLADTAVRIEFPANDWPCATWGHQQARRKDKSAGLCLLFLSEKTRTETGTNFAVRSASGLGHSGRVADRFRISESRTELL